MLTSFNTQPPEGGCICSIFRAMPVWFQHTATRRWLLLTCGHLNHCASFNTQPPEGGCKKPKNVYHLMMKFQHTATRRWLRKFFRLLTTIYLVSTHSHPKVAAQANQCGQTVISCFNTQPPEGGCEYIVSGFSFNSGFNTQPPEGGCAPVLHFIFLLLKFQHTATRRWLLSVTRYGILSISVSTHSHPKVAAMYCCAIPC